MSIIQYEKIRYCQKELFSYMGHFHSGWLSQVESYYFKKANLIQ